MIIIHANDSTTKVLSLLYEQRGDVSVHVTEAFNNGAIQRAIRDSDTIMMLGHGNQYGLFSCPRNGKYERFLITDRHVQFLRNKTCIGIWCYANLFAEQYGLHGLFSEMIISELQEAIDLGIHTDKEEIGREMIKFASRLRDCIDRYGLHEIPLHMRTLDDARSELSTFNYRNLYYYE